MSSLSAEIADLRKNYTLNSLDISDVQANPLAQFQQWFDEALASKLPEPNAMVLATTDSTGQPSARVVLLKGLDDRGFLFKPTMTAEKAGSFPKTQKLRFASTGWSLSGRYASKALPSACRKPNQMPIFFLARLKAVSGHLHQSKVLL